MNNKLRRLLVGIGVTLPIILTLTPSVYADTFLQNRVIDDGVFDNTSTLNAAQIDAFLNSFTNSCISPISGFRAIDPTGYSPSTGFQYGGYVTAGQVIFDAAQAYDLNPQVLIVTLEKEQSLVTGQNDFSGYCNNGDQHKYAAAVGYGCPDGGTTYSYDNLDLYQRNGVTVSSTGTTCVNTAIKAGFTQQIIRAAWLFKFGEQRSEGNINWAVVKSNWDNSDDPQACYGGPMTQGTYQRCPSGGTTYYDGYTTIDATAVHMDNGATAALYWYTPHFHGNQIFFNLFSSWFGSTILACGTAEPVLGQVISYYNPVTYDHFYTSYQCEGNVVQLKQGYRLEGAEFNTTDPASVPTAVPVYRLYNPSTTQHLWTTSQDDINNAVQNAGFHLEGIAFYSAPDGTPGASIVWRLYNAKTYQHVWTGSQSSILLMTQQLGFKVEGIAFFSQ